MLGTKYHAYKHSVTETTLIRTTSYSLPSILHDHVTVVTPSTYFGHPKPLHKTSFIHSVGDIVPEPSGADGAANFAWTNTNDTPPTVNSTCNDQITPSCLNALYNISYTPVSTKNNSLGVVGYLDEFANHADLQVGMISRALISSYLFHHLGIFHEVQARRDRRGLRGRPNSQRRQQPERPGC